MQFNDYLKSCRTRYGLTQEQLVQDLYSFADVFEGLDIGTLSRWERGVSYPSLNRQVKIVKYFQQHSHTLFPCFEDKNKSAIEDELCRVSVKNLIGSSKEHIMNFPSIAFQADDIIVKHLQGATDIDHALPMLNTLMQNFSNNSSDMNLELLKQWILHPSNLFLLAEVHEQFFGLFFNLRLKPGVFEKILNFEMNIFNITDKDFASFDEMGSNYPLLFFANNDKVAALLFVRYYAHLIANQNNILEVGTTPLRDGGKKIVKKMMLVHYKDKETKHGTLSAFRAPLSDVLINESVLRMIFQREEA